MSNIEQFDGPKGAKIYDYAHSLHGVSSGSPYPEIGGLMRKGLFPPISVLLSFLLCLGGAPESLIAQQAQQLQESPPFRITVIEGEGSINNIRQAVNRGATVMVEDENKNPLSGVAVAFFLPNEGPSGVFPNGSHVLTVFTDDKGMASSRPVHFNNLVGLM